MLMSWLGTSFAPHSHQQHETVAAGMKDGRRESEEKVDGRRAEAKAALR